MRHVGGDYLEFRNFYEKGEKTKGKQLQLSRYNWRRSCGSAISYFCQRNFGKKILLADSGGGVCNGVINPSDAIIGDSSSWSSCNMQILIFCIAILIVIKK